MTVQVLPMAAVRAGIRISITKDDEEWRGTVLELRKPNKYVLYVEVDTYIKQGVVRSKWKKKPMAFGNSSRITITADPDDIQSAHKAAAEARKAYKEARKLIGERRETSNSHFKLLGLDPLNATIDDIRRKRKQYWNLHPDIIKGKLLKGEITEAWYNQQMQESNDVMAALDWATAYIQKKNS